MISEKMQEALNEQVNKEFYSAYLYLAMAVYCDAQNMDGFAKWLQLQAQEEVTHGMKIYGYLRDRGAPVTLGALEQPQSQYESFQAVFEKVAEHEAFVTSAINNIANMALEEKDQVTYSFMDWFLQEQIEEEATADSILQKVKLVGDSGNGLFALNAELGRRTSSPGGEE